MAGFTKLFSGLVHSTVWREEMHVKVVWITMLALADRNGHVLASMPGLADASRVSLKQCEEALAKLSSPDKHSRTKEHEGRRIHEIDGGWALYNYLKYRNLRDDENRRQQVREAVARHRSKVINVSHGKPIAEAEAEAEAGRTEAANEPPDVKAEKRIRDSKVGDERRLLALVAKMEKLDPKERDAAALMQLVTSYDKPDGRRVGGCVNPATLSYERVQKSIADAEVMIAEWEAQRGPGQERPVQPTN